MNFTKALDLMNDTEKRMKETETALRDLRNSLAAIAELDNGAKANLILKCDGGASEMYIGNLMDEKVLTDYVRDRLEIVARLNFERLLCMKPEAKAETPEDKMPELKIPEELAKKKEQREDPEPVEKTKINGKINDDLLKKMYFKDGKSALQIVRETGLSESAVFSHLAKLRAEKEQAAKECARQN